MRQLSGLDTAFLHLETASTPMIVGSIVTYQQGDGEVVRFKEILEHIESRLPRARCFRERLLDVPFHADRPYWVDDERFDLEYHVRHVALPKPGDWRQLCIQAARILARPLDMRRPLWEMTVIEGLDAVQGCPPGSFAIVIKIHHAAIDGVSGAEIFEAIHDLEPAMEPTPSSHYTPRPAPTTGELLVRATVNNVARPLRALEAVGRAAPGVGRVVSQLREHELELPDTNVMTTRFNSAVSPHRVIGGHRYELGDIKTLRSAVPGATVNDVVISIVGGALRAYLTHHDELPSASMVAMAPISTRSTEESGEAGNRISSMFVQLGTDIDDPVVRLAKVAESTAAGKKLDQAIGAQTLTDFAAYGPLRLASRAARFYARAGLARRTGLPMHTMVTNVPGPQQPLFLGRSKVLDLYGSGPITDGMGLIHPVFSYDGGLTVCFTADRAQLPDPERYAAALESSATALDERTRAG